ncbi:CidA/LrgA family protein [Rhizobium sp. BK251]|uniref:CidA/LrgA family protein n=1 Tax=Rhizobium sp. BK251 TaxID=2512125 RepID=UPI001042D196|nr:CidA/LrgA family protein [Rhizobium sp. BK251]TCL64093.1 putative effector of murein hydrolase LrgA (UPF0299 family) [Rhizobium sp. BK251]
MVIGLTILLLFQLLGEVVAYLTGGVVPGPVIGMALISLALGTLRTKTMAKLVAATVATSKGLLANLGVLFVPAGVGIVQHLDLIASRGLELLVVILVSTTATLIVTVFCFLATKRLMGGSIDE